MLADVRRQRGYTGTKLAELSGLSQSQITRWEHGQRAISVEDLYTVCAALEIDPWDFMAEAKRRAETASVFTATSDSSTTPE